MRVRAKAIALSTASNWLFNFGIAWAVPPSLSTIAYKTYFVFGAFNLAAFIHIFFMFPETAGHTLEEVEGIFEKGHTYTAWRVDRCAGLRALEQVVEFKDKSASVSHPARFSVSTFLYSIGGCEGSEAVLS
jgi:hypothetical protein